jgi:hypothetical protein
LVEVLASSVDRVWWRETTLLYTARAAADPIIEACLTSNSVTALALAFEVAEGGDFSPELRGQLDTFLDSPNTDSARQLLRGAVIATKFLRRGAIQTKEGGQVYGNPVTRELFQAFCAERARSTVDVDADLTMTLHTIFPRRVPGPTTPTRWQRG